MEKQSPVPFAVLQPLGLFLFLLAGLAEVGRTPFDIYHAESEIMGGPFVEYSGAHWAIFYLAEYINTFLLAALIVVLFLGGWSGPLLPPIIWFLLKTYAVVLLFFWFRGTFPRLRIDQLMALAWKVLVPLSFFNLMLAAAAPLLRLAGLDAGRPGPGGARGPGGVHLPSHVGALVEADAATGARTGGASCLTASRAC